MEYGIDSDGFFALPALPERVAVVGAGYIAVELAGVINGLGAKTHLFVRKHAPLRSDPMITETGRSDECRRTDAPYSRDPESGGQKRRW